MCIFFKLENTVHKLIDKTHVTNCSTQRHWGAGLFRRGQLEGALVSSCWVLLLLLQIKCSFSWFDCGLWKYDRGDKNQGMWVCEDLDKRSGSFSPSADNFLAFFVVFGWGAVLKNAMDKNVFKSFGFMLQSY